MKIFPARLLSSLLVCLSSFLLLSCSEDDANSSANVGLGIKAFFPTKVVTNQPMTINGSGLSAVTEVEFPGGAKASDFQIVSDDMIRVNTPAGVAADGGKIIVRTADAEAQSPLSLTVGHTLVTGFSKQPGETASGGELITVYGSDLEFINSVELLDADGEPQLMDHRDFYRKGTGNLVFRLPRKDIFKGTFTGLLHTYDGQTIPMPELAYEPGADEGHWETVKTMIWQNPGTLGEINWSSDYRFAPASNSTGEECYTVPQDVWEKMKTVPFYVTIRGANPQIRVTSGWWSTTWTGDDLFPGNDRLTDLGDGTFTLMVDLAGDPLLDVLDAQHLLFTGSGYTVEDIYFAEDIWVDGPGMEEVKVPVWTNGGTLGEINWSSDYRFAPESNSTGEECYTVPQDIWERLKTETFYVTVKGASPQIRVTSGWWSTTWLGDDIFPGNELLQDNGDGTFRLAVTLAGDPLLDVLDAQHLLFTGSGYTVEEIYFIELQQGGGGGQAKEVTIWQGDGVTAVNWNGTYRFGLEGNDPNSECIVTFPADVWQKIKTAPFRMQYVPADPTQYQIRVTNGWWDVQWLGADNDIAPWNMSERIIPLDDGTFYIEVHFGDDPLVETLDQKHLLFTGSGYTPLRLYFVE